jgi:hypothetical protein
MPILAGDTWSIWEGGNPDFDNGIKAGMEENSDALTKSARGAVTRNSYPCRRYMEDLEGGNPDFDNGIKAWMEENSEAMKAGCDGSVLKTHCSIKQNY